MSKGNHRLFDRLVLEDRTQNIADVFHGVSLDGFWLLRISVTKQFRGNDAEPCPHKVWYDSGEAHRTFIEGIS